MSGLRIKVIILELGLGLGFGLRFIVLVLGLRFGAMFSSATLRAGAVMHLTTINHILDGAIP